MRFCYIVTLQTPPKKKRRCDCPDIVGLNLSCIPKSSVTPPTKNPYIINSSTAPPTKGSYIPNSSATPPIKEGKWKKALYIVAGVTFAVLCGTAFFCIYKKCHHSQRPELR